MFKKWFYNSGVYDNRLEQAYYAVRLWIMNSSIPSWSQIKFDSEQRWASTRYSLSVWKWHKPCIECWGSKTSVKYGQEQPCREGCGVGYRSIPFWYDMKDIFYPSQKLYNLRCWLKQVFLGCSQRHPDIHHEYCVFGTCGCQNHPLVNDWKGKPLTSGEK